MINILGILCLLVFEALIIMSVVVYFMHKAELSDNEVMSRDKELGRRTDKIREKNSLIKEKNKKIEELENEIRQLKRTNNKGL